jgi:peptide-methionine (S)-S-oxide reductase
MFKINNYKILEYETATFGAGCFWCVEAIFQQVRGIVSVVPGYSGGSTNNPTYNSVIKGSTGHVEVCQIIFDKKIVSFDELLEVFWLIHDPTSYNKQDIDIGSQFRSVIFYHNDYQKISAIEYKKMINESILYPLPVITDIVKFKQFYKAELYHQDYFHQHNHQPYCLNIIKPKIEKFRIVFKDKLKSINAFN